MENTPITQFVAWKFQNQEDHLRFGKWAKEVFYPVYMKSHFATGIDRYQIIKENPEYCNFISIFLYSNYRGLLNQNRDPEMRNVTQDMINTWKNKRDVIWNHVYQIERSFRTPEFDNAFKKDLSAGEGLILHLEAFDLPIDKEGDYYSWFSEVGYDAFISRIIKRPGVLGYDHLRFLNVHFSYLDFENMDPIDLSAPAYASIFYFDNIQHCQDFKKSREFLAFKASLTPYFPEGLRLKWDVDYKLIGSWRENNPR